MTQKEAFCLRLNQLKRKGLHGKPVTNTQLAQYLGVSRQVVSQYTTGQSFPSIDNLKRLSDLFSVTVDYMLGASANEFSTPSICAGDSKGIKMQDVIQKVSDEYRSKRDEANAIRDELRNIKDEIAEAHLQMGENITMARYKQLTKRQVELEEVLKLKQQFCDGMAYTRELLMDFGFDIDVA